MDIAYQDPHSVNHNPWNGLLWFKMYDIEDDYMHICAKYGDLVIEGRYRNHLEEASVQREMMDLLGMDLLPSVGQA